jgi:hypothetical protein
MTTRTAHLEATEERLKNLEARLGKAECDIFFHAKAVLLLLCCCCFYMLYVNYTINTRRDPLYPGWDFPEPPCKNIEMRTDVPFPRYGMDPMFSIVGQPPDPATEERKGSKM